MSDSFGDVVEDTPCLYSSSAKWREVEAITNSVEELDIHQTAKLVRKEIKASEQNGYDMLALQLPEREFSSSIDALSCILETLLPLLSDDLSGWGEDKVMMSENWRLWIEKVQCFVLTFAPFYSPKHPRYSPTRFSYIVFQFESAFKRRGFYGMDQEDLRKLSKMMTEHFKSADRWYLSEITHHQPEALRVLKPLRPGDEPIAWWKSSKRAVGGKCE